MALHGDAVPVVKVGKPGVKSFDAYSISSLIAVGKTRAVKQDIFGFFEKFKGQRPKWFNGNDYENSHMVFEGRVQW